jgi:hypothetical protein
MTVALVDVGGGRLALTHRPKLVDFAKLRTGGVTHLVTLLSEREGAPQLGDAAKAAGLAWIWIPLPNGDPPSPERTAELVPHLDEVVATIRAGGGVVVHCSAGIHRTGMIGNALLRRLGLSEPDARAKLAELREVTAKDVGAARLAWGDALAAT